MHDITLLLVVGECVTDHPDFEKITVRTVLEINLKMVWNTGKATKTM